MNDICPQGLVTLPEASVHEGARGGGGGWHRAGVFNKGVSVHDVSLLLPDPHLQPWVTEIWMLVI